ncbi:hypothetical protein Tco_0717556 [Tanacetum coccineum]
MLKVAPWKGVMRFGKRGKLNPRYIGPFQIIERIGPVAYRLELPQELSRVHNVFHVCNLKKCLSDDTLVIPLEEIQLDDKLNFIEEPVEIMGREVLRTKMLYEVSCIAVIFPLSEDHLYCLKQFGGNLVTWRSKKQKVVALSSAEAEFRGIARGITEVLWIRKLLTEIGYPPQEPSKVVSDNKAAIQISENPVQHDRTKHIEIDRHFIKEKLEAEVITFPFVRSQDQLADILTKAVNERTLHECLGKLNFGNPTIQLEGEC